METKIVDMSFTFLMNKKKNSGFTNKDMLSTSDRSFINRMDTDVYRNPMFWGAPMWFLLHTLALVYPVKPSKQIQICYRRFFTCLPNILPCSICRNHLSEYMKRHPVRLDSRVALVEYVLHLHNHVNVMYKRKPLYSFQDAMQSFDSYCLSRSSIRSV